MTHRRSLNAATLIIALVFTAASLEAHRARNKAALVVVPEHDLPETAQMFADSMYLRPTGNGDTYLYLEQQAKNRIIVLNATARDRDSAR